MLGLCNYFLSFTWPLVIIFFNTFACLLKSHKPKSDNIVQLKIAICIWSFYMKNTPKNCKAPQFSKIYYYLYCLYFLSFYCVKDDFCKICSLVLMGSSVYIVRFLVCFGGLLLWFLRKWNTPVFMRKIAIERVIKFFSMCANLIVKVSWVLLVSKIANVA